ncbi:Ig-like domain repeat protein [Methanobrevibacter sp.]|uniref:Ppx/GppA phosphatase family protein n=1 Tax=Methanobrevibacter sp. TaxID=66852 RepID=UPI00386B647B
MKFKLIYLVMIIVIFSSIAAVSAGELNETLTADVSDDLALEDDNVLTVSQDNPLEDYRDESILNISGNEDNVVLHKDDDSTKESESPLYGIVDIGSNSMELRIYEIKKSGKPKSVFSLSEKSVTAIYVENNTLSEKGIDEFVSIMKDFNVVMDLLKVKTKYAFATASLRKIDNSEEVIAAVKKKVGLDIHLLSGEKEAMTSFNAVKDSELTTDQGIVIDLGGGSCEVIDFVNKTVITSESMPIGSNSIYTDYVSEMFPNGTEIKEIENRVLDELKKLSVTNDTQRHDLFGLGGSVKTIKKVLVYFESIDDDTDCIPVSMMDSLLDIFSQPTKDNYQTILNINSERINTFVPGLVITRTIANYFNISYLHFCKNTVRDGIMAEILENESRETKEKQNVSLNVSDISIAIDENAEIPVTLPSNATGTVKVKLDNGEYVSSLLNGSCIIILPKLQSGNYSVKITYSGDDNYASNKTKINVHVKSASLNAHDMVRGYNSDYDYQVKLIDENGNGISNKLISFTVMSNQYYAITNGDGFAGVKANLNAGTYNVTVSSAIAGNSTVTLKILKRFENNSNLNVYYASNANYKVRIIGDDGNPETEGQNVTVLIDNKMKSYKTDKNGFITVEIDKNFKVGTHTIKIQYRNASVKNKVAVKHLLALKSATVKKSAKKLVLTANLAKVNGKYLKNKKITFKFNGKTYKSNTNSKGIAKVTIKSSVLKMLKAGKKVSYQAIYLKDTVKRTAKILK